METISGLMWGSLLVLFVVTIQMKAEEARDKKYERKLKELEQILKCKEDFEKEGK